MIQRFLPIVFLVFVTLSCFSQSAITTEPALPIASQKVTITFDSSKESRLGKFTGDLYAHTGVTIQGKGRWQNVIESWGNNNTQPKLTNKGNGIYELEISPDINSFYNVSEGDIVTEICVVFRSSNSDSQTNDIFINVFEEGLNVQILSPNNQSIFLKNELVKITALSSIEADLKLFVNQNLLIQTNGTEISSSQTFTESGGNWLIAEATANNETVRDSAYIYIRENQINENLPIALKKGINYTSNTSAALVLWAPSKEYVFVVGDFNDWKPTDGYQMKKDGDYFWLEIPNLEKSKEYIFQYFIDGEINVADPYSEKTVNPWDDKFIKNEVYPNLIQYPFGKTDGVASVLKTGQEEYVWEVTDFQIPAKEKMVIYELLIRDFTVEQTYKAVREKLDYLEDLNINVLELMPVNEFEGNDSWGYNPAFYFAPDKYYGQKKELKKLIDECHKRGIAVVIDMVLNHTYGQSPLVQMYMDNWTIIADNPWYNIDSPNQTYKWGFDFNHEAEAVKELVDSVNSFWMNEYKVDGFRFDFTKGFTQTPGDGWAYDASRIALLKRMADEIWKRKPGALVILEHLADNSEEKELADYGMMLWGNMNEKYRNAAKGETGNSNLSWGIYSSRAWTHPNLVTYAESHDEERVIVDCLNNGKQNGSYNTRQLPTALDRAKLNAVFHIPLPGPKMIWQFGERGYDISINAYGGRTNKKPPKWDYLENEDRLNLFRVISKLNHLKQTYEEFSPDNFNHNLGGEIKRYTLTKGSHHVFALGNFALTEKSTTVNFPVEGRYYEFFTGDSIDINMPQQNITLAAGEYRLYSTKKMEEVRVVTELNEKGLQNDLIKIYPNPATSEINFESELPIEEIQIYSLNGQKIFYKNQIRDNKLSLNVGNYQRGIYIYKIVQNHQIFTGKICLK